MAQYTQFILLLPADAIHVGNIFGGDAHMIPVKYFIKSVKYHQVIDIPDPG